MSHYTGTGTTAPVRGFLPIRPFRSRTLKTPNLIQLDIQIVRSVKRSA
jgi:hypothetical protein